jgi:hypothetical protein
MLDGKSKGSRQTSPNYCTWNTHSLCEFLYWRELGLIQGLENCVVDNMATVIWMRLLVLSISARCAKVGGHRLVCDCIWSEDMHKFTMNWLSWKSLPVEIETNYVLILFPRGWPLTPNSIFDTKKRRTLDHKSKDQDCVSAKYVLTVWAMNGYY